MKKRAFSLIEFVIVTAILTFIVTTYVKITKNEKKEAEIKTHTQDIQSIKNSIEAYLLIHNKLPMADTDGDGKGDSTGRGTIPYIDLNLKRYDRYGSEYVYDVTDSLTTTTSLNICFSMDNVDDNYDFPILLSKDESQRYNVAAIVISKGKDKILNGENNDSDRYYLMSSNSYDETINDDESS